MDEREVERYMIARDPRPVADKRPRRGTPKEHVSGEADVSAHEVERRHRRADGPAVLLDIFELDIRNDPRHLTKHQLDGYAALVFRNRHLDRGENIQIVQILDARLQIIQFERRSDPDQQLALDDIVLGDLVAGESDVFDNDAVVLREVIQVAGLGRNTHRKKCKKSQPCDAYDDSSHKNSGIAAAGHGGVAVPQAGKFRQPHAAPPGK